MTAREQSRDEQMISELADMLREEKVTWEQLEKFRAMARGALSAVQLMSMWPLVEAAARRAGIRKS